MKYKSIYYKIILLLFLGSTRLNASLDHNISINNFIEINARVIYLEQLIKDINKNLDIKDLRREYATSVKEIKEDYKGDINLLIQEYKSANDGYKESKRNLKEFKEVWSKIFLGVLGFLTIIFAIFGYKIWDVSRGFKRLEEDYKTSLENLKSDSERAFRTQLNTDLELERVKQNASSTVLIGNLESKVSELINTEDSLKQKIKVEVKNELKDECEINCDNDSQFDESNEDEDIDFARRGEQ